MSTLPISPSTWQRLVKATQLAVSDGWAKEGVFATAIGPLYVPGGKNSLLYVGKSRGPKGSQVGSEYDQAASAKSSTEWMTTFQNRSGFWQFVDRIDPTRQSICWTNVCKVDRSDQSGKPPRGQHWAQIRDESLAALEEEIAELVPRVVVFVTGSDYRLDVSNVVQRLRYKQKRLAWDDTKTILFANGNGQFAIQTRHPQGWSGMERDRVIKLMRSLLK